MKVGSVGRVEVWTGLSTQDKGSARPLHQSSSPSSHLTEKRQDYFVPALGILQQRGVKMSGQVFVGSYVMERLHQLGLKSIFGVPGGKSSS